MIFDPIIKNLKEISEEFYLKKHPKLYFENKVNIKPRLEIVCCNLCFGFLKKPIKRQITQSVGRATAIPASTQNEPWVVVK